MQLFIHFGLYKTGSSYLQTFCANNRSYLEKFGFYFPKSVKDSDMMAGKITPGNGNGIAKLIKNGDVNKCRHLIKTWCDLAVIRKCNKILISDEALIHGFANDMGLKCLYDSLKLTNIQSVSLFAFFRNPVDHCLSTYKHRAKRGGHPDFKDWVINYYETPLVIKSFLNIYHLFPFDWKFAKYNRNDNVMVNIFFNDWLGIPVPFFKPYGSINSSLTLSEIIFIQMSILNDPKTVPNLYTEFSSIKYGLKAQNNFLDNYYYSIASNHLLNHVDVYERLNFLIFNNEKIEIPSEVIKVNNVDFENIAYSEAQLNGIIRAYKNTYNILYIFKFYKSDIARRVFRFFNWKD